MRGSKGVSEPFRGFGRERAGDEGALEQRLDFEERGERARGGELRAVEQREPFFRPERDGLEAGLRSAVQSRARVRRDRRRRRRR